jgi:hypothetical protein
MFRQVGYVEIEWLQSSLLDLDGQRPALSGGSFFAFGKIRTAIPIGNPSA